MFMIKNIFFDRDGTLGVITEVRDPHTFPLYPDAKKIIDELKKSAYLV